MLRAGLSSAAWITVDDTGARHKAANGFCTQIGNAHFTWFGTTASKSRLNFLALLRAGHDDYVVNAEALAYMRERALAAHVIARLVEHPDRCFADQQAWTRAVCCACPMSGQVTAAPPSTAIKLRLLIPVAICPSNPRVASHTNDSTAGVGSRLRRRRPAGDAAWFHFVKGRNG